MNCFALSSSPLFRGLEKEEIPQALACLSALERSFEKGDYLLRVGQTSRSMGLVLSGLVQVEREDVWGRRLIMAALGPGQLFGESYACVGEEPLMVSVVAAEPSRVLFLDTRQLLRSPSSPCSLRDQLIANLLTILAGKNLYLTRKIEHMSRRTIREKALSYLSFQAERAGSRTFSIPFDRQELADYLGVDRSALSAELSKMRREGLLTCQRRQFTLL